MTDALPELARVFLKLGTTAFGGPAAHIALMHQEVVVRRQWLTPEAFLDLIGATNLIPGPNSTEMAIHLGYRRAGWRGLVVAGICFIVPAVIIVWCVAALYVRVGMRPDVRSVFRGVAPVMVVIVAIALWKLAATTTRSASGAVVTAAAIAALALGVHELVVLALGAVLGLSWKLTQSRPRAHSLWLGLTLPVGLTTPAVMATAPTLLGLFWVFLKAGGLLFGSGYVLIAFLRADLVTRLGWLTESQLMDAIAIGQMTPGPVFTTATFIGYLLAGSSGALVATVAIFLPAFVYVAISGPLVPWLRRSPLASGALDGVNAASLALMAVVSWQLARSSVTDLHSLAIAAGSVLALLVWRVNPTWPILGGAAIGWLSGRLA
jgi:chromate transporter